jgi:hypothetical protein
MFQRVNLLQYTENLLPRPFQFHSFLLGTCTQPQHHTDTKTESIGKYRSNQEEINVMLTF